MLRSTVHPMTFEKSYHVGRSRGVDVERPRQHLVTTINVTSATMERPSGTRCDTPVTNWISSSETQIVHHNNADAFKGEVFNDPNALIDCLSPVLRLMKVFGLCFLSSKEDCVFASEADERLEKVQLPTDKGNCMSIASAGKQQEHKYSRKKFYMFYSISTLILLWGNALRFLTVFNDSDSFNEVLFTKLVLLSWMWLCAINQTSAFIACQSGRLRRILTEIRITHEDTQLIRRKVIIYTAGGAAIYFISGVYFLYAIFCLPS